MGRFDDVLNNGINQAIFSEGNAIDFGRVGKAFVGGAIGGIVGASVGLLLGPVFFNSAKNGLDGVLGSGVGFIFNPIRDSGIPRQDPTPGWTIGTTFSQSH